MTNRYRSSCCCDEQRTSVCFNGFGSVPKTAFAPRDDMCIPGSESTDGFNRYDNWSFCLHDKNEEILAYSERTRESFESGVFYPGSDPTCDCSCCNDEFDLTTITSFTLGKPPIYAWYRHMRRDGTQTLQLPSHFVESSDTEDPQSSYLYVWRSQWREQIKTPPWLLPCCADDHKYENAAGYAHDYFCVEENESWLCGYDVDDKQWMYWRDDSGNLRYVTQTEMKLIGHPDYDGWRTNNWGVIQGSENRCGPDIPGTEGPYELKRNAGYCERGGQFLFLQDILHNGPLSGDGRLYRNFTLNFDETPGDGVNLRVVPDYGYGNCETPPYGLWPLNFTFWGVLRREKWWELYWNSIYRKYVCERDPDTGEYINCPDPYENYEEAEKLNIYPDKFAGQCRFPRHIIQACAGVPIFTHELVDKLDDNLDVMDWWATVRPGAKEVSRILDPATGQIVKQECDTPAALVMGAIAFSSPLWPEVTQKLEEVGILPPPIDYGEDQDYKIFKKTFKYHAPIGSGPTGACCINVESSFGGDRPLYGDCGSVGEGTTCPDESTGSCNEPGADEFCCDETPGRTGCGEGLPEGSGGLCDDYICGINIDINDPDFFVNFLTSGLGQAYQDRYGTFNDEDDAIEALGQLRFCCGLNADGSPNPDGFWDDQCIQFANFLGGATCGPQTLCAEINESVCRYVIGGQFHEGSRCVNPEGDPDTEVVQCVDRMDEIGSCCFYDRGANEPFLNLRHCMEISKDLCDQFNADPTANDWGDIFSQIPETTVGGSQQQKQALQDFAQSGQGIQTQYTGLRNCEPLPASDPIEGLPLDTYSFYCGGDPYENNTDYPCDDPPFAVNFEEDDYYFYGSPGGWSHTCFSDESITDMEPGDDPPVSADIWNEFFPQVRRRGRSICNSIAPCWTAAPYPQQQFSDPIPRCDRCCPAGGCPDNVEDCPFQTGACGEPLLSGCGILEPEYYPGDDADDPNSDDYDSNPYPEANTGVFTPCIKESVSSTCFGAWFQSQHINFGNAPSDCLNQLEFECVNINNAFFLRVPDGKQEVGEDYTLALDILEPGPTPGGNDESEWGLGPAILAYINRVLGETIRIYEGYQHKIFMTDGSLNLNNLEGGRPIWLPPEETVGSRVRLILLRDAEDGEEGIVANGRELVPYNGNDIDFIVNDNGGAPGANLFLTIDLTQRAGSPNPIPDDIYWGLVFHDPFEEGEIIPVPQRPDGSGQGPGDPGPLFGYYKLSIGLEGQNPGPVVHGLRDYNWYHAPVVGVNPRPSAFFNSDWACSGDRCCHDKLTEGVLFLGEEYSCPLNITDKQQGQPGGESECNYTRLPSDGEGLPDPLCGPCEDDEYCCAYPDNPRCVPKETYCCSECEDDEVCVFVQPDIGEEPALRCVPREEWESP